MSDPIIAYAPASRTSSLGSTLASSLEVTVVIGVSVLAAVFAPSLLKIDLAGALGLAGGTADLLSASLAMLQQFAIQYGALLILVIAIGLWRRRTGLHSYALGTGNRTRGEIVRYGMVLGLVAGIPATALLMLQQYAPIGTDTPMWAALRSAPKDLGYWTFLAVSSFALVPLLEEFTWRGYVLGRFAESLAPGAAVVATAVPFAFLHSQYASTDPAMLLATLAVLVLSFAMSLATIRTGSIWPAVIAHAIVNSPIEGVLGWARLAATVTVVILCAKAIAVEGRSWAKILFRRETLTSFLPLCVIAAVATGVILLPGAYRWAFLALTALAAAVGIVTGRSAWERSPGKAEHR